MKALITIYRSAFVRIEQDRKGDIVIVTNPDVTTGDIVGTIEAVKDDGTTFYRSASSIVVGKAGGIGLAR